MKTGVLLIDHGSRFKGANHMLFDVVKRVRDTRPDLLVYGAHMELAPPTIDTGVRWLINRGISRLIAHPYMLAPGRHATRDIPDLVHTAMQAYPEVDYTITAPLGVADELVQLILKRSQL